MAKGLMLTRAVEGKQQLFLYFSEKEKKKQVPGRECYPVRVGGTSGDSQIEGEDMA